MKIRTLASVAICLSTTIGITSAAITIHGSTTAYQETGGDWLSMGTNDIDGSGGLGTDGFIFFDDGGGAATGVRSTTTNAPSYVSSIAGIGTLIEARAGYGLIDNPVALDGTDIASGAYVNTAGGAGSDNDLASFTIVGLAAGQTVRVGVLGGIVNGDGRWDSTSFTLTDGTSSATVGDHTASPLALNPGSTEAGWVFFDLDSNGSYVVSGTKRVNNQGSGIGGLTFDSIVVPVPEPSSAALLGLSGLAFLARRKR